MKFNDKELIIFDFDGTLINSIPDLALAVNSTLAHFQLPTIDIELVASFVGNGAKTLVERSLAQSTQNEKQVAELFEQAFEYYLSAYEQVSCKETYAYPGVLETLEYLHNKGYKMVICTNKPYRFVEAILDGLYIKQYFQCWIGEDSIPEKKPNATPLLYLCKEMNTAVEKAIMVGDSKNDILAAQNARMDSIGLSYGYNYNEHIADYKPTIVVDNFAELQKLF